MFRNLKNKKFHDLSSGKIVTVVDQFEDVAILEGKQRMSINKLLDDSIFQEYIDPKSFFTEGSLQTLAEKIRSIPNEMLSTIKEDSSQDESLILPYDPEEEINQLLEKAKRMVNNNSFDSQMDKFKGLIEEDSFMNIAPKVEENITKIVVNRDEPPINTYKSNLNTELTSTLVEEEDPMSKIFKNIKRKNDFEFSLTIENKIPRPDFIEMMEDSYEVSIIDFLADEFTKKLLSDPNSIKEKIKQEISDLVYKKEKMTEPQISDFIKKTEKVTVLEVEKVENTRTTKNKNKKKDDTTIVS